MSAAAEPLAGARRSRPPREALGRRRAAPGSSAARSATRSLGREVVDVDLAVDRRRGGGRAARSPAAAGGPAFELSAEFGTWRALARGPRLARRRHPDPRRRDRGRPRAARLHGQRDRGAARRPRRRADRPVSGGAADLERGVLRAVSERSFADDPLRLLRAARLAAAARLRDRARRRLALARGLGVARRRARRRAPARRAAAAGRGPDPLRGLELLDELGATAGVLPELEALRGVEQNPNHHLDVHGHTIEVLASLLEVEARPRPLSPATPRRRVRALLAEPLADEFTRGDALRFGAVLHDVGKPATREEHDGGFVTFIGHDRDGRRAGRARLCARLKTSRALARHLEALTLHHLHLGFMARERPLPRRRLYDYLKPDRAGRRRRHPAHGRRPALGPRQRPDRDPGDDRGAPRAGARGAAGGARLAPRRPAHGRRSPATSSPPSSGSSRAPSSAGCSASSRPPCSPAR